MELKNIYILVVISSVLVIYLIFYLTKLDDSLNEIPKACSANPPPIYQSKKKVVLFYNPDSAYLEHELGIWENFKKKSSIEYPELIVSSKSDNNVNHSYILYDSSTKDDIEYSNDEITVGSLCEFVEENML